MFRDTASYIGSICFFSFQLNRIYQTFIAFLLCQALWLQKWMGHGLCPKEFPILQVWSLSFSLISLVAYSTLPPPPPPPLFFFFEKYCFFCLHHMWVGFLPSTVSKFSPLCSSRCCSLPNSRAIAALGRWAYASGFEKEASCHNQRIAAKSLVNHGFVRGKNSQAAFFFEFWEEKWLWF